MIMGSWFRDQDLDFVALYFGEPDSTGHKFGPDSPERKEMVRQVDRTVGYLRNSAERHGLGDKLNVIITADHGMSTVQRDGNVEEIVLRKIPNFSFSDLVFHLVDYGPTGMLLPKEGQLDKVYNALKGAHPHLHVYKKEEMPNRLHFANNDRILPIILWADPGYVINGVRYSIRTKLLKRKSSGDSGMNENTKRKREKTKKSMARCVSTKLLYACPEAN